MEIKERKKCTSKEHLNNDATTYCPICRIYMCNKCNNNHSSLFLNHSQFNLDEDIDNIFTGFCKNENHPNKLEYFCKNHNELCCAACLCKINEIGDGEHKDCDVCIIKKIKDQKKNALEKNIKKLEDLSSSFEDSIKEIKNLSEKINKKKEDIIIKIQSIFTKIRNEINNREDKLLLDIDNHFNKLYFNDDIIKLSEKLPKRIKHSLERAKQINKEWDENKLNFLIHNCINIEKALTDINEIKWKIEKSKFNIETKLIFKPEEKGINKLINIIENFGEIYLDNYKKYALRNSSLNENKRFLISGESNNILTKTWNNNNSDWIGSICINNLDKSIDEHKWKIKIIKTNCKAIMVGVAPIDFDINSINQYITCGWFFDFYNSCLYSGPPFNYSTYETNLSKVNDEIIIIMNMKKRTLKFIINNEDKGESYTNIPIDKPIFPAILLVYQNDSVEIIE